MNAPQRHIASNSLAFSSYWTNSWLSQVLPQNTSLENAEQHVRLYYEVDELGDAFVKEYFLPLGFTQGMQILHELLQEYPNNKTSLSENTQKLFEQLFERPSWVNDDLLLAGAEFCNLTGTSGLATLRNYCLMGGYESSAINKPLIFTGALKKGAVKRLSDTVVFWMNVTDANGLPLRSKGFYSAVTTRIIHSYSRLMIEKTPGWQTELWGRPLNMWDMLATNLGFSIAFIDGLQKLGFQASELEIKGVLHLWKYVGYLLGIPPTLLPDTKEKAAQELFYWSKTQKGADEDSAALAFSLYEEPTRVNFTKSTLLKKFVQSVNLGYNHYQLGASTCNQLKLPKKVMQPWIQMIAATNRLNQYLLHTWPSTRKLYLKKGRKQQVNVLELYRKPNAS